MREGYLSRPERGPGIFLSLNETEAFSRRFSGTRYAGPLAGPAVGQTAHARTSDGSRVLKFCDREYRRVITYELNSGMLH